jgi:hypothetical protein
MSKMSLHDPFGYLKYKFMAKGRVRNEVDNLILDHYKSGIALTYLRAGDMSHNVGKLSMRATTLL